MMTDVEKKIKIDDKTIVTLKTPPPSRVRPEYSCKSCGLTFPSQLDLEEHIKIDHSKKSSTPA